MKRLLVVFALLLACSVAAVANDVYVAQTPVGAQDGSSCSSAVPVNTFVAWVPGLVLHLCGQFTGGPGAQVLAVKGGGTAANPITIRLDGATLSAPYWSPFGAINASNESYVVVDGGGTGIIENTANGTALANHQSSRALYMNGCTNCSVRNLTVQNLYVHNSVADTSVAQTAINCVIFLNANGMTVHNLTCHDVGWALAGSGNNFVLEYSNFYHIDHGIAWGASGVSSGFSIHDNHFHDYANWDTTANTYHHDGIHMWGQNGGTVTNGQIFDNLFDGDSGVNITAHVYLQDSVKNVSVFNNIFVTPSTRTINSLWFASRSVTDATAMPGGFASNNSAYNNYINAGGHAHGSALVANAQLNFTAVNNVVLGGNSDISLNLGTTIATVDNNTYEDLIADKVSLNPFGWNGGVVKSLAAWQTTCRCDWSSKMVPGASIVLGKLPVGSVSSTLN